MTISALERARPAPAPQPSPQAQTEARRRYFEKQITPTTSSATLLARAMLIRGRVR